jgi:hypothetical protein
MLLRRNEHKFRTVLIFVKQGRKPCYGLFIMDLDPWVDPNYGILIQIRVSGSGDLSILMLRRPLINQRLSLTDCYK